MHSLVREPMFTKPPPGEFKSRLKPDRLDEIILIARALLVERGFDAFTLDEVALRARCSKTTLYRRWSNKSNLIVDVIGRESPTTEPNTGSLRGDLEELLSRSGIRFRGGDYRIAAR